MRTSKPYTQILPGAYDALIALQKVVDTSGVDPVLLQLVGVRASQINGCCFCLGLHANLARKAGLTQGKLDTVAGWRDDPAYTAKERAALAWTETMTRITDGGARPEEPYAELAANFDEKEIVALTLAVAVINVWNRMNVALATPPLR